MPGPEYLTTSYYEHWLYGLELLLVEKGLITAEEMRTRRPAGPAPDGLRVLRPDDVPRRLRASRAARMDDEIPAQFKAGDEVVARTIHPMGHTRLDRKSTRLNSSHVAISYAVFCLKKKKNNYNKSTKQH